MADDDVTELGTLLAGEVDGAVDELAAYILASPWLAQRDARIRAEALREAADEGPLHFAATHRGRDARGWNVVEARWLRERADRIEAQP